MVTITIRFFAMCREVTACDEEQMELPEPATVEVFWQKIISRYPGLGKYKAHSRVAVNREYGSLATVLRDRDEVCIVPPVSGG
jgi:molybdopterin converting factor subunit 1